MARYVPNTYKNHRVARFVVKLIIALILALVILTISLFFGLRRHITYTPDGLKLDIPWLEEVETAEPDSYD